jgi:Lon protease-like protein
MEIPLFPLHQVLCPGIVLPLHIFEDRYQAMTRHCLDTGQPFGVVLIRDGREVGTKGVATLAGVGAFAEIREAGRYPDGRYDLLAAATGRFAIESVDAQKEPYLVADVTPLEDEVGDELRAERLAAKAIRRFVRYLDLMRRPRRRVLGGPRHPRRDRSHGRRTGPRRRSAGDRRS